MQYSLLSALYIFRNTTMLYVRFKEEFEDTKGLIRIRKPQDSFRQYNGQKKKY